MLKPLAYSLLLLVLALPAGAQTRLYVQNAPESFDPAPQGAWDDTTPDSGTLRFPCLTTKAGPIATVVNSENSAVNGLKVLVVKCISAPLSADQTLGGPGTSMNWVLGTREANTLQDNYWRAHVWVSQGSTNALRGTLLNRYAESATNAAGNEWPAAHAQGWKNFGAAVPLSTAPISALAGDRVIIEIGAILYANSGASYASALFVGGTDVNDLQLNGDETKNPGWFELSQTISFTTAPLSTPSTSPVASTTVTAVDTVTVTPTQTQTPTIPNSATPSATPTSTPLVPNITVNSLLDLHDGLIADQVCSTDASGGGPCTLRAAVETANAIPGPVTVNVPAGTYPISLGEMAISTDVLIQGTGNTNAVVIVKLLGTTSRAFSVAAGGSLTLKNLTVLDNRNEINAALKGACVYNEGTVTLDNAVLDHCDNTRDLSAPALGQGGGVYNAATLISRNGTRFDTGVSNWGACLFNAKNASADLSDTTFLNCHTLGLDEEVPASDGDSAGGGAGIFNAGTVVATRTSFIYCRARLGLGGGGILNGDTLGDAGLGVGGTVSLTNVTFARNRCRRCEGGAFKSYGGTINAKLTTVASTQSAFLSGIILRDGAVLNADRMIIEGHNISDPSSGFENCYTATGAQVNLIGPAPSMDDSGDTTPPRVTCPGFTPVVDLCLMTDRNYGGLVDTVRLNSSLTCTSPAIDAGGATCGVSEDGRGLPRPVGAGCDLGSFEVQP